MNKLWRGVAIFVLGGVLGTGFGVALGFFIFPYVFPPPAATEQLADADRSKLVASGSFIHAKPIRSSSLRQRAGQRLRAHRVSRA